MKKTRLVSIMFSLMLVLVLAVGAGTFALFTDTAINTGNEFRTGTIDLYIERDMGDSIPGPMFYSAASDPTGKFPYDSPLNPLAPPGYETPGGWAPGDNATRALNIYNRGTLDLKITQLKAEVHPVWIAPVTGEQFHSETQGPAFDEFIEKLNVIVKYPSQNLVLYDGSLNGLLNGYIDVSPFLIAATPSGPANITFEVDLDRTAGNELQDKNFIFDFSFKAEQMRNN